MWGCRQTRTWLCAGAMALVSGIGGGISGAWAETPDSVALPLSYKGSDAFPNLITVGVGGGAQGNVTFDVGSTGFYVLESVVGPDVTNTGIPFEYGYEDGTEFTGYVGETIVSFKTATGTVETETVRVGVIENFTCSGGGTSCMDDRVGVMGVRYYQYKLSEGDTGVPTGLFNPLAFLPDNLASGYMVAATGPTPSIIVGLTANNIQGMPSTTLTSMNVNTPIEQFAPLAWELKSIEACFQVEGNAEQCDVTSFDTGESDAQFTAPPLPTGDLPAGTRITITIESVGITRTFVAGDTNWVDKFNVLASPEGEPPGFNSGAQFYNSYAIAYDYFSGRTYFSPITTWITGTYQPTSDADLGPSGAIALAGALVLPNGFSSTRPIFIGNDSTITSLGTTMLGGTLSGNAALTLTGPGLLTLAGKSLNTGPVHVTGGGTVYVDGSTPAPFMLSDGTLGGNGAVGALTALSGGLVAPGHSIGTLRVDGDVSLGTGSTYAAEIGSSGKSDRIVVDGSATINNAELLVLPDSAWTPGFGRYTVLTADGGVTGAFKVSVPAFGTRGAAFPFLGVSAFSTSDSVIVEVGRSDVSFAAAAQTRNQRAAGFGADQLDESRALLEALAKLNFATAPAALDAISGEIYASAQTVMIEDADFTRDAILGRLRQVSDRADRADPVAVWAQGYGGFGENDGNGNATEVERNGGGFIAGFHADLASDWRGGLVAGAGQSSFDLDARRSSGSADGFTLGAYSGGHPWDNGAALYFGTAYSWLDIETNRHVVFPGFSDSVAADYDGGTFQLFGEAGYAMSLGGAGPGVTEIEPFAGLGLFDVHTGRFEERGGPAALAGRSEGFSFTASTLGVRTTSLFSLSERTEVEFHGSIAWQHAFGERKPGAALAFAGQADPFVVYGVPLAEDSVLLGAGLDAALGSQAHIGVAYLGAFAESVRENAFRGELSLRF